MTYILGISAYYHDSAAALLKDGVVVAAAQEERFTRKKHDESYPEHAVAYCLKEAGITAKEVDYCVFYDKPIIKFERIISTYLNSWPRGFFSYIKAIPLWIKKKLWISSDLKKYFPDSKILFCEHHLSHAAGSYYASAFEDAAILTTDGVGEFETTTFGYGKKESMHLSHAIHFPHSLGLLYSAFTYYLGFKVNSGEYKVMGLAPYGKPHYIDQVRQLFDVKDDGSFQLDMSYFSYEYGLRMTNNKFNQLFGGKPRNPESPLTQKEKDIAASLQYVLEEVLLNMVEYVYRVHPSKNLCLSGGVALNCVANGRILRESSFEHVFIQPASGDAGGALGAAYYVHHHVFGNRKSTMQSPYLGPSFSDDEISSFLSQQEGVHFTRHDDNQLSDVVSGLLADNHVVGWFQDRMEFGPRALGNRSILADPQREENWKRVNLKIKFRESFRPFAPAILAEHASEYFDLDSESPYMLLVSEVKKNTIPAVTHVNNSARVQTVSQEQNARFHELLTAFHQKTGCPVLINTSFNVRGEPIVCTPEDAFTCFMRTDMDYLVLGNYILDKKDMPQWHESRDIWQNEFVLD